MTFTRTASMQLALLFAIAVVLNMRTEAQPILIIDDASIFEGNEGTTVLKLPVRFVGTQNTTVTGLVSAIPLSGPSFSPATGGDACGVAGVDFEQFVNVPFSIPPNTPNGTLSVNIAICGDTVIERDEQILVSFSNVSGADCTLEGCSAVGTILDDDGPPRISINNISVSTLKGLSRTATFTVSLNHTSTSPVSVHFATRDGTAQARTLSTFGGTIGDYVGTSGTLVIQPNTLSSNIPVTILGTGGGTFFVDLSNPVNGTIFDGTGQCTIQIKTLTVGAFEVTPDDALVQAGETINYAVTWTVPAGEVWRNLKDLDFRIRKGNEIPLLVHWDEAANTFSVCQKTDEGGGVGAKGENEAGRGDQGGDSNLDCITGAIPGSLDVIETPFAQFRLAESSVVGSGPTGQSVTLNLAISFGEEAAGHSYRIELAASDDFGNHDNFVQASSVGVQKTVGH